MACRLGWWSSALLLAVCLQHVSGYAYQNPDAPPSIEEAMSKSPGGRGSWKLDENGHMHQEGNDMVLSVEQYERLHLGVQTREARHTIGKPWKDGIIPYTIVTTDFKTDQIDWIKSAMKHWEDVSCVRFRPATSDDRDHIKIITGKGCWSHLGEMGGEQIVNLDPYCFWLGIIEHELGHSIGLIHEHQRPERDAYIRVDYYGVQSNFVDALEKYARGSDNKLGLAYDYTSLMHYMKTSFSKDGISQVLFPRDPTVEDVIGMTLLPSFLDAKLVSKMYKCEARCTSANKPTCSGECFLNADCRCVCPNDIPKEVCQDRDAKCPQWMQQGECRGNSFYMFTFCRKSCGLCKTDHSIPRLPCINGDSRCDNWSQTGQCESNPGYMLRRCRLACGVCKANETINLHEPCQDKNSSCSQLAAKGGCIRDPRHMLKDCKKSCEFCPENVGVDPYDKPGQCVDFDGVCYYWADNNLCGQQYTWMSRHCKKACGLCDAHIQFPENCYDTNKDCHKWAMNGECENNPRAMLRACNESCDSCQGLVKPPEQCLDHNFDCKYWAEHYECWGNPGVMKRVCPQSCKACPGDPPQPEAPCMDFNKDCQWWQSRGECEKNPVSMSNYCKKACGKCTGNEPTTKAPLTTPTTHLTTPGCTDNNRNCAMWANTHQCEMNPGYMNLHCRKYCDPNHCQGGIGSVHVTHDPLDTGCVDRRGDCQLLKERGDCESRPRPMLTVCRKSCTGCTATGSGTIGSSGRSLLFLERERKADRK